jgi:outer membrane protein insertion porin family
MIFLVATGPAVTGLAADQSPEGLLIDSIEVAGNVTLTRAEVLSAVSTRAGQNFRSDIVNEDVRRIAKLEAAETAYINTRIEDNKVFLTYVVVEHNLVRSIVFKGNNKLKDTVLAKELSFKKGDYLDAFAARAGIDAIKEKYISKGYPWIQVTLEEAALIYGQVSYLIQEGARCKIKEVRFMGNTSIPTKELRKAVKTKKKKFLFFSVYYDAEQLEKDTEKLLEVYQKKSFLDANISRSVAFNKDKSRAYVTFAINEGPVYFVDSIQFAGYEFFTIEQLRANLKLRTDYYFSEAWADYDTRKIESLYREKGFIEVKVHQQYDRVKGENRVKVIFKIEEGGQYRIGDVTITGNETFKDRTIRRIMDEEGFTPGQLYNGDLARGNGEGGLEKIIKQSLVAETVTITPVQPETDGGATRDALAKVTEGQTGSIMLGAGIGSDDGVIGQISLSQRNFDITDTPGKFSDIFNGNAFRGAGQQFRMVASPGSEYSSYSIGFTEPYLYDKPIALNLGGSFFERQRETYDEERLTGTIGLQKRYPDKWQRGIRFRAEDVKVSDLDFDAPEDVQDEEGSNMLFGTRFYIQRDTTNNRFLPSKGHNFDLGYEQVVGDYTFGLLESAYRWYTTLSEDLNELKTVLETKLQAGTTVGNAPSFERFYVGGTGKWGLRGFEYRGISPRQGPSDEPVGSDWAVVGKAEVAVPLGNETFSWLFFSDAGLIDDGGVRAAVGTGIQLMIPQFFGPVPMRFELASPLMKDDLDDTQAFSFSVGALF